MTEGLQTENIGFDKGIVRTPSIGAAGELSECVNLISKNGELVNIQPPVEIDFELPDGDHELKCIHETSKFRSFIVYSLDEVYAHIYDKDTGEKIDEQLVDTPGEDLEFKVIACGNVIVLFGRDFETRYFFLKDGEYSEVKNNYDLNMKFGFRASWSVVNGSVKNAGPSNTVPISPNYKKKTLLHNFPLSGQINSSSNSLTIHTQIPLVGGSCYRFEISGSNYGDVFFKLSVEYGQDQSYATYNELLDGDYLDVKLNSNASDVFFPYVVLSKISGGSVNDGGSAILRIYLLESADTPVDATYHSVHNGIAELYNKFHATAKASDLFSTDFFVRYAVRLITGEIVSPSAPVLFQPNLGASPHIYGVQKAEQGYEGFAAAAGAMSQLRYYIPRGLTLSPLIESIVIGCTLPIYYNKMDGAFKRIPCFQRSSAQYKYSTYEGVKTSGLSTAPLNGETSVEYILREKEESTAQLLENASTFRVIKEIPVDQLVLGEWQDLVLEAGTLTRIEGESGDYLTIPDNVSGYDYSKCADAFVYNRRLSFFNIQQKPKPLPQLATFEAYESDNYEQAAYVVSIATANGTEKIAGPMSNFAYKSGRNRWLFYPNPKARSISIYEKDSHEEINRVVVELKPHPFLNGAYYYGELELEQDQADIFKDEWNALKGASFITREENKYITSALNQPLVPDDITGYIGSGEILGVSTSTKALSQGQFGQFPLQFFCSDGIWAVNIGNDGSYQTTNPVSRDVLINPDGLVQTDGAIIFPTAHGLKVLQGSDTQLLSAAVHGLNIDEGKFLQIPGYKADKVQFLEQIKNGKMVYDYVNQLLHVFFTEESNTTKLKARVVDVGELDDLGDVLDNPAWQESNNVHYVYSMESGQWSKQWLKGFGDLKAVVPGYPYTTMQFGNKLYQYRNAVSTNTREGFFLTRPLTLGNPHARKALWDLRLLGQKTSKDSNRKVWVFYSDDNIHWYLLKSLKGLSAKYYRLFVQTSFTDIDTLSGVTIQYLERFTNKLR